MFNELANKNISERTVRRYINEMIESNEYNVGKGGHGKWNIGKTSDYVLSFYNLEFKA